uniref:X8 domain-containing protein n=1 Tax=Ananas comosus var. bracteatus TaxID=296719 RepID=A0A6V7QHG1_ANACO|nr:unnamed protein product [Ananas comosus var. bracteatus]
MATATTHNPLPPLLLLLLLLITTTTTAAASGSSSETGELWCVAKNNAEDAALQAALDWACGPGGADCRPIQPGGACYEPDDIQSLASFAFNDYFLRSPRPDASTCDFSGTAALTSLNPGHGSCIFPSRFVPSLFFCFLRNFIRKKWKFYWKERGIGPVQRRFKWRSTD